MRVTCSFYVDPTKETRTVSFVGVYSSEEKALKAFQKRMGGTPVIRNENREYRIKDKAHTLTGFDLVIDVDNPNVYWPVH